MAQQMLLDLALNCMALHRLNLFASLLTMQGLGNPEDTLGNIW